MALSRIFPAVVATALALTALVTVSPPARGDVTLWYNGDNDGRDTLTNGTNLASGNWLVYDNFVVPVGYTYTVTGVFSDNQMNFTASKATFQIRSNMSAGNGGTLLDSGDGAATQTLLRSNSQYSEYRVQESIAAYTLSAGTYWLAVAPDSPSASGGIYSFIETTSGANAVGQPKGNDGNSFVNAVSSLGNIVYQPTTIDQLEGPGTWDYSMGLVGTMTSVTAVPEPGPLALAAVAVILAGLARRASAGLLA